MDLSVWGVNFDYFTAILLIKKTMVERWNLQAGLDVQELHTKIKFNFRCKFWLIYSDFSA